MLAKTDKENLEKYIPESEMVKIVFQDMHPDFTESDDFNHAVIHTAEKALKGDKQALFILLELTAINAYNEGLLDETAAQENID